LMSALSSWLSAVAAEAERWLERLWSARPAIEAAGSSDDASFGGHASGNASALNATALNASGFRSASSSNASGGSSNARGNATVTDEVRGTHGTQAAARPSCLQHLYAMLLRRFDPRPASFVRLPEGWSNGWWLLGGSDRVAALSESVVHNHAEFAKLHGYAQWWHRGSLVSHLGYQPYWHKVAMLRAAQARYANASGFVWLDDDIVLTNHAGDDMLQRALASQSASVLVTRDPSRAATLNTGVMIVRNDARGREVLDELWRRATAPRADGVSLAFDTQNKCLHEQQALQEMAAEQAWRSHIAVLAQRHDAHELNAPVGAGHTREERSREERFNLNTFLRWSHYHAERDESLRFDADAHGSGWLRGDFAGHCSGLSPLRRALCVAVLMGSVKR